MDRFSLFPTPLFVFDVPDTEELNRELENQLLLEAQAGQGIQRSNVGGWHSTPNLAQRPEPCFHALMELMVEHVRHVVDRLGRDAALPPVPRYRCGLQSWAMILRDGDYVMPHDHGDCHFSTVYYVDAGDPVRASGKLTFVDPRQGRRPIPERELFPSNFTVDPRSSALVIFPGWLQHYVHPYRGERPRISISANVVLELSAQ